MKTPHHTQTKLAASLGLTIDYSGTEYVLGRDANGVVEVVARGTDLKALLTAATPKKAPKARKAAKAKRRARKGGDEDEDGEDADEEEVSGSVVKAKYKARYNANKVAKGTCGDEFAVAFTDECQTEDGEIDMASVFAVAKANEVSLSKYRRTGRGWEGRIRMTLGNILRGMRRRGTDVKVGRNTFKGLSPKAKPAK